MNFEKWIEDNAEEFYTPALRTNAVPIAKLQQLKPYIELTNMFAKFNYRLVGKYFGIEDIESLERLTNKIEEQECKLKNG